MALEKTDLTDNEETETNEPSAAEVAEQARKDREAATEARARELELKAVAAESALAEARRQREPVAQQGVSEEQWQQMESETGKTRQQIAADAKLMSSLVDIQTKPLRDKAEEAEKRARAAEEKSARIESRRNADSVKDSFYEKNVALKGHKKDVDEFLAEFPDSDNVDAKTLEKRLGLAVNFVKGKIKEGKTVSNEKTRSSRLESSDETKTEDEVIEFDARGTENEGQEYLMRRVLRDIGKDVRDPESIKHWKEGQDPEGKGVRISSQEDVDRVKAMTKRGGTLSNR